MGKAHQLGCPKIVLDHMGVYIYIYIYIYIYMFVGTTMLKYLVLEVHVHELGTHYM